MALGDLLAWWNLVFLLPAVAGLCLAFVSTVGSRADDARHSRAEQARERPEGLWTATRGVLGVSRVPQPCR